MKAIRKPTVEKIEVQTVKAGRLLQVLKRLWKYLYGYKWYIVLALFLTVAGNLWALWAPAFPAPPLMPSSPAKAP